MGEDVPLRVARREAEGVVDALIDLLEINAVRPWGGVGAANEKVGVKESRPNPFGLPDLLKPQGWVAPNHAGNHGLIDVALKGTGSIPRNE